MKLNFSKTVDKVRNHGDFLRIRIFNFQTLKWFLLSVITISALFTVSSAFLFGFQNQSLFTDNPNNNVLVISQPTITPAESRIPLFWVEDIQQLKGVSVISPETVDIVIDQTHGQTPYFRGVTSNYRDLFPNFKMVEGLFFDTSKNISTNGIIVGSDYAKLFNIHVGDKFVLQARTRTEMLDIQVIGIFNSNSIADDGILGPIWIGRLFSGLTNDLVNLIQIKFDTTLYTKAELENIILGTHILTLTAINPLKYDLDISKTTIQLYNRFKEKINQSLVNTANEATFAVPFGKYYVNLLNPNVSTNSFVSIFITKDLSLDVSLGTQYANFSAKFSISGQLKQNATVIILNQDVNKTYYYKTDSEGKINDNLPIGALKISFTWRNYQNSTLVNHEATDNLSIDFDYKINLILRDASTNSALGNIPLSVQNIESNQNLTVVSDSDGNASVFLQPDTKYALVSANPNYNRTVYINSFNTSVFILFLGKIPIQMQFVDVDNGVIINQPVSLKFINPVSTDKSYFLNTTTDSDGLVQFNTMSGTIISASTPYGLTNFRFEKNYTVENIKFFTFYVGKQEFFLSSFNNENNATGEFPLNVAIKDLYSSKTFNFVLNSDNNYKLFLNYGNYSISASNNLYSYYNEYNFNMTSPNEFLINFNRFKVNLSFTTKNGTIFFGNFQLAQKINSQFIKINSYYGSNINTNLQDGIYRIGLNDINFNFSSDIIIKDQNVSKTFTVTEKLPELAPVNFNNFSIINSSLPLFISSFHSKSVQYTWNYSFHDYNSVSGITPPNTDGTYNLTIKTTNFDNVQVITRFFITIDNTGPIITLVNQKGNNTIINYNLLPSFTFSERPKFVLYTWNTTNLTSTIPTALPSINGWNKLTVQAEDFAGNMNIFYYNFKFDNQKPLLTNKNPLNNSIINMTTINLTFSEPLSQYSYNWGYNLYGTVYYPSSYDNISIPAPNFEGINFQLIISFIDLAGNSNSLRLIFPYVDQNPPIFLLTNNTYNNEVFNQINESKIYFSTFDTNNTIFYKWNSFPGWNVLYTDPLYNYCLQVPYINGNLTLDIMAFDEYNPNDIFSRQFNFTGNFTSPQFNVSLTNPIQPNQVIKILFPFNIQNWTIKWNNIFNQTGTTSYAVINSPTTLVSPQLNLIIVYPDNSSSYFNYTFIVQDKFPSLSNPNISILSYFNTYLLTFPSYVTHWNYTWDNSTFYSGFNTSTILQKPFFAQGNHTLFGNYSTIYSNNQSYVLTYYFDSIRPSATLLNVKDFSRQRSSFLPSFTFSETLRQVFFSWDGSTNTTQISPMPKTLENQMHNLTIYMEDFAKNWNLTTFSFYQDNTPINIFLSTANTSINNSFVKSNQEIIFTTSENASLITCSWNDQIPYACTLTVPIKLFQGQIKFVIRVYDSAGNGNSYSLILKSDTIAPILLTSTLENNSVINHYFLFNYSFSEPVASSNSIYAWDSFNNNTGFPSLNATLMGFHTLHWWFSDNQSNWNYYIFNVYINTNLPFFNIIGNISNTIIGANTSLLIKPNVIDAFPIEIFTQWDNNLVQNYFLDDNSTISLELPQNIGSSSLLIQVRDNYGNWNNQTYLFEIKPFINLNLVNITNLPVHPVNIVLYDMITKNLTIFSTNTNNLFSLVNPDIYNITLNFSTYNLTSTFDLRSQSISKTFILKEILLDLTTKQSSQQLTATVTWVSSELRSTALNITGSAFVFSSDTETEFNARIANRTYQRNLDVSQNIKIVNFTLDDINMFITVVSSTQHVPVTNAIIKGNQTTLGITDSEGKFTDKISPGSYFVTIYYSIFTYNFSIQIFEDQKYIIELPVYSNITIIILNNDLSAAENIQVKLFSGSDLYYSSITNFNGQINLNRVSWGNYKIVLISEANIFTFSITIGNTSYNQNIKYTFTIPTSKIVTLTGTTNLGKWTFNRDYQISTPNELSDKTLENLGFSVIFPTLFLIILLMTVIGLISIIHQPIFKLKQTIRNLSRIGSSQEQILELVSVQFGIISFCLSLIGYFIGYIIITFWPNLQQLPIAGMIIKPAKGDIIIPLALCISFSIISMIYSYKYTKKEYFSNRKENTSN